MELVVLYIGFSQLKQSAMSWEQLGKVTFLDSNLQDPPSPYGSGHIKMQLKITLSSSGVGLLTQYLVSIVYSINFVEVIPHKTE